MQSFIEVFGDIVVNGITIGTIVLLIAACVFLYKMYQKFKQAVITNHTEEEAKDKKLNDTYEEVEKYHDYRVKDRAQSLKIQKELTDAIKELKDSQKELKESQKEYVEELKALGQKISNYELADTKERLMISYRYFTSPYNNPMKAWTDLERDAFMETMRSYESNGGDGHMHTVVLPAMEELRIVSIQHTDEIAELMHSRR